MLFQLHLCYNNKSRWVQVPVQRSRFSPSFNIGFLAIWWSSKPIRTSFPLPSVPLPIPAPTQCVCVCVLHAIPVTSLSSRSAAGSFCSVFNQNECGYVCVSVRYPGVHQKRVLVMHPYRLFELHTRHLVRKCSLCIRGGYWCVHFPSVIEQRWRFRWWWSIIRYKQLLA